MSIYTAIAASILPVLPEFSVGGSLWTIVRTTSGNGVTGVATVAAVDNPESRSAPFYTLYFVRNAVDKLGINVAGTALASAEWLCFAAIDTDVQTNDLCTSIDDTTRKFRITGAPQNDFGLLFAPAKSER